MNVSHPIILPSSCEHDSLREGVRLGLIMATVTWLWVAVVDIVAGQPFHTFSALGGIALFTIAHFILNVGYGVVLVSAVHGAERTPSNVIAIMVGVITLESVFAMLTNLLSYTALGGVAWASLLGGSLIGVGVGLAVLSRGHPLATYLRRAEEET